MIALEEISHNGEVVLTIHLDEQDKTIVLKDQNENVIRMGASGLSLESPKNITLKADQTISLKGAMGVSIEASSGDVTTAGMNIKHNADMEYKAEGSMTASLLGGTETTIKGAMVMIN